jgi:hypothetical protein
MAVRRSVAHRDCWAQQRIRQRPQAIWREVQNPEKWTMGKSVIAGSCADVGALQPVFSVGFDPGTQRHHGDAS